MDLLSDMDTSIERKKLGERDYSMPWKKLF